MEIYVRGVRLTAYGVRLKPKAKRKGDKAMAKKQTPKKLSFTSTNADEAFTTDKDGKVVKKEDKDADRKSTDSVNR